MAFVRVTAVHRPRRGQGETVTMGLYLADGKHVKRKTIGFRFTRSLLDKLGWPAGHEPYLVSLFEGIGEDVGFWQIAPDKEGYSLTGKKGEAGLSQGRAFQVNTDSLKHYVLNEPGPITARPVSHIAEGSTLIIECPDWLKFNPQSVSNGAAHQTHVVTLPPLPPPVAQVPATLRASVHQLDVKRPRGRPRKER
jgi:hypothetical protein